MAQMKQDVESQQQQQQQPPRAVEQSIHGVYKQMLNIQESTLVMMLVFSSALEFFASVGVCSMYFCTGYAGWAISAGIISLVISALLMALMHAKHDIYEMVVPYVAGFLFVWWIPGAGVTTFASPFGAVGNGYFGAWGAFLSSFFLAHGRLHGFNPKDMAEMLPKKKPAPPPQTTEMPTHADTQSQPTATAPQATYPPVYGSSAYPAAPAEASPAQVDHREV